MKLTIVDVADEKLEEIEAKLEEICEGKKSGKYKSRTIKAEYELAQGLTKTPENSPEYTMKLFDYRKNEDWGKDYYFTFLKGQKYSLLQVSFSVCEYASFPYVQVNIGMGKLFGIFVYAWKLGFDIDVFGRTWWV